eukprot:SAG31_NODE_622_length_13493_cov_7.301254_4_plen_350_part_00
MPNDKPGKATEGHMATPMVQLGEPPQLLPLGLMRQSLPDELLLGAAELKARLERDGYLFLKGAVPRAAVLAGQRKIARTLAAEGWLRPGTDPRECLVDPTLDWDSPHPPKALGQTDTQQLLRSEEVSRVLNAPELHHIFQVLFDEKPSSLDFKWLRAVRPGGFSGFHMDNVYMGRGSEQLHTVWIPWHDVDLALGGLAVLGGSHNLPGFTRVRETYGRHDTGNGKVRGDGWLSRDPAELMRFDSGARWLTAELFEAGDIVLFPMKLLHGSVTNTSRDRLRLSCDVRFQPASHAHDDRYTIGEFGDGKKALATKFPSGRLDLPDAISMAVARDQWGIPAIDARHDAFAKI